MVPTLRDVIWAKLSPERKPFMVSRPRLVEKLREGLQYKAVLVTAAAGYGKTTLLYSFVSSQKHPFVWYRFGRDDVDPVTFLSHLLAGIQQLPFSGLEQAMSESGSGECLQGPEGLVRVILANLSNIGGGEIFIVLDDYERIEGSAKVNEYLEYLVDYLPPACHLFLLSRTDPEMPWIARLRQYGELLELTEKDLAFTLDEIATLFDRQASIKLSDDESQALHTHTGGWGAVLPMVCRRLLEGDTLPELFAGAGLSGMNKVVYEYFAQCVVSKQPRKLQRFLEETAILVTLTGDACDAILGTNNAKEVLRKLYSDHLFVSLVDTRREHYLYHSLFRLFLQHRLAASHDSETIRTLRIRAAGFFEERGEWEEAIHHFVQAASWEQAATVTRRAAESAIEGRRVETIRRWIEALPPEYVNRDPKLLFHLGSILRLQDSYPEAWVVLEKARDLYRAQTDPHAEAGCLSELGTICFYEGRSEQGVSLLQMAWEKAPTLNHALRVRILAVLSINQLEEDRFAEALAASEEAFSLLKEIPDQQKRCQEEVHVLRCLGWVYLRIGRIDDAIRVTQQAIDMREVIDVDQRNLARDLYVLMNALHAKGELTWAQEVSARVMELATKYQMPWLLERTRVTQARIATLDQDYPEAERLYRLAGYPAHRVFDIAWQNLLQGHLEEAHTLFQRVANSQNGSHHRQIGLSKTFEAVLWIESGDPHKGKRLLLDRAETFHQLQLGYHLATVEFHLARVELDLGDIAAARKYLREAMQIAKANDYFNFFVWHPTTMGLLCAEALSAGIFPDYAEKLAKKRLKAAQLCFFLPLLSHGQIEVRERASRIVEVLRADTAANLSEVDQALACCGDQAIRNRLLRAVANGELTTQGLHRLKHVYGLTWREIDVFLGYYLAPPEAPLADDPISDNRRKLLSSGLFLSENTLRDYIKSIRNKLGFTARRGSFSIHDWALREGLRPSSLPLQQAN